MMAITTSQGNTLFPCTRFELPFGAALVLEEREGMPAPADWRQTADKATAVRDRVRAAYTRIVNGRMPARSACRPAIGASLMSSHCGTWKERQYEAYVAATGMRPRSIADYLRSIGITDTVRHERALAEWTGKAAPVLECNHSAPAVYELVSGARS